MIKHGLINGLIKHGVIKPWINKTWIDKTWINKTWFNKTWFNETWSDKTCIFEGRRKIRGICMRKTTLATQSSQILVNSKI